MFFRPPLSLRLSVGVRPRKNGIFADRPPGTIFCSIELESGYSMKTQLLVKQMADYTIIEGLLVLSENFLVVYYTREGDD